MLKNTSPGIDVDLAVRHCLCQEDVEQPRAWWRTMCRLGRDQSLTDHVYRRLVARFCGPATTVEVPTAGLPRKVVRSWGEAIAETGLRFSSLTITPCQVAFLNKQPEPQLIYLQGPPGTGKTVVLLLKALQWVQQGRQVVIVSGDDDSRALSLLLEEQLRSMAWPAPASIIQRLCCDFGSPDFDVRAAVTSLQQHIGPGPALVICDEFDLGNHGYFLWLTEVRHRLPAASVWTAGIYREGGPLTPPRPFWLQVETLQEALRCPPSVTAVLQKSYHIQHNHVPRYTGPQVAVATQGPPVQRLRHDCQPGHSALYPWECVSCAALVANTIQKLRVGQPGQPLQFRDIWILYGDGFPRTDDKMVQQLQQQHRLTVTVVSCPPSEDEVRELALAVTDRIMVTGRTAVQGLERRVVMVLGCDTFYKDFYDELSSWSRSSSSLYIIV